MAPQNRTMDAAELERIAAALKSAFAQARLLLAAPDAAVAPDVRNIVRHAREMHDLLLDALHTSEPLGAAQYRWIADSTGNAVDEMEALVARADGKIN